MDELCASQMQSQGPNDSSASANSRVFETLELFEAILLMLTEKDYTGQGTRTILHSQRVSKGWQSAILNSGPLQRVLCFQHGTKPGVTNTRTMNVLLLSNVEFRPTSTSPLWIRLHYGYYTNAILINIGSFTDVADQALKTGSWRQMHLHSSTHTIKHLRLSVCGGSYESTYEVDVTGLRLGELLDLALSNFKESSEYQGMLKRAAAEHVKQNRMDRRARKNLRKLPI